MHQPHSQRLCLLDAFRGLVILAMLVVNNIGDHDSVGYFWKHADWITQSHSQAYRDWWQSVRSARNPLTHAFSQLPLWKHCTLADFVMPGFMLIIGVSMPFSIAAAKARGVHPKVMWLRVLKRAAMLVLLGWVMCYFRDQFAPWLYGAPDRKFSISLGMDVLQLLGIAYLAARILYTLPPSACAIATVGLFVWQWGLLRFGPVGENVPRGTFSQEHEAIRHIYETWPVFQQHQITSWLSLSIRGMLSVPPAAATMLAGTFIGDWLRSNVAPAKKASWLALLGVICAAVGFVWGFDMMFNKPRWSPSYLVYNIGVDALIIAAFYAVIEVHQVRQWSYPLVVLGTNAIGAYFVPIVAKALLLNTPRVDQASPWSMVAVKYAAGIVCTTVVVLVVLRLARWLASQIGRAGWALGAIMIAPLAIFWQRMLSLPTPIATNESITSLAGAVGSALKHHLGQWEGGWAFAISFVLFWWLVLDLAHRHRVHWKL